MLKNLPEFLKHYSSGGGGHKFLSSSPEQTGSPHTIVVTSAGLRAADIARYAMLLSRKRTFVQWADVAKGFAYISDKGFCGG